MTTLYKYIKRSLKQASNKKVRPHEFQEGNFDSRGKWTPNYEDLCEMTLTIMDGDKLTRSKNAGAVKKYSVKKVAAR
jgi:hypothetical protein